MSHLLKLAGAVSSALPSLESFASSLPVPAVPPPPPPIAVVLNDREARAYGYVPPAAPPPPPPLPAVLPEWLSKADLALRFSLKCTKTIDRWADDASMGFPQARSFRGKLRWRRSEIEAWEASRPVK